MRAAANLLDGRGDGDRIVGDPFGYTQFAAEVAARILPFVTEFAWAEVINARGKSFDATIAALGADWGHRGPSRHEARA